MSCSVIINLPIPRLPQSLLSWIYPDLLVQKLQDHTFLNVYFPTRRKMWNSYRSLGFSALDIWSRVPDWSRGKLVPWNSNLFHVLWIWDLVSSLLFFQCSYFLHCFWLYLQKSHWISSDKCWITYLNLCLWLFLRSVAVVPKSSTTSTELKVQLWSLKVFTKSEGEIYNFDFNGATLIYVSQGASVCFLELSAWQLVHLLMWLSCFLFLGSNHLHISGCHGN